MYVVRHGSLVSSTTASTQVRAGRISPLTCTGRVWLVVSRPTGTLSWYSGNSRHRVTRNDSTCKVYNRFTVTFVLVGVPRQSA